MKREKYEVAMLENEATCNISQVGLKLCTVPVGL